MTIYLIGSLRNPQIPNIRQAIEDSIDDSEVFASWYGAGEVADDRWMAYEKGRGLTYRQALKDYAAQNVFKFDKTHIDRSDAAVLVYPSGRSGHLELGYAVGKGKRGYILLDKEPERWDVMLAFADDVFTDLEELIDALSAGK